MDSLTGLHAAGRVFARQSHESARYNALLARYRVVLSERGYNAEIYRDVARRHNALVLEVDRLEPPDRVSGKLTLTLQLVVLTRHFLRKRGKICVNALLSALEHEKPPDVEGNDRVENAKQLNEKRAGCVVHLLSALACFSLGCFVTAQTPSPSIPSRTGIISVMSAGASVIGLPR